MRNFIKSCMHSSPITNEEKDSMLSCLCSAIDRTLRQNVMRAKKFHTRRCLFAFFSSKLLEVVTKLVKT